MNIGIIGSGNVAFQLSRGLFNAGHKIDFVHSRNSKTGKPLAKKYDSIFITDLSVLPQTDVILIAVNDDQIEKVSSQIKPDSSRIVLHTSGAIPSTALNGHEKYGILYPLYSFSHKRRLSLKKIPFLITSSDDEVISSLRTLALDLTWKIYQVTDEERAQLHVAAVFANNFANFMMSQAFEIVEQHDLDLKILLPIIQQSTQNWNRGIAKEKQTGPAIREDYRTMDRHIDLIKDNSIKEMYKLISQNIIKFNK